MSMSTKSFSGVGATAGSTGLENTNRWSSPEYSSDSSAAWSCPPVKNATISLRTFARAHPCWGGIGRYPRKPMTAWEGALALSKLDIRMPASTSTPRRKGRPIQGSSSSRVRGGYPKLPLAPLSPTPKPSSRGHLVPIGRYDFSILFRVIQRFCLSDAFTFVFDPDYVYSVGHQDRRPTRKSPRCQLYPPRKSLHPTLNLDQNMDLDQVS